MDVQEQRRYPAFAGIFTKNNILRRCLISMGKFPEALLRESIDKK
jgi:hypothetical protein